MVKIIFDTEMQSNKFNLFFFVLKWGYRMVLSSVVNYTSLYEPKPFITGSKREWECSFYGYLSMSFTTASVDDGGTITLGKLLPGSSCVLWSCYKRDIGCFCNSFAWNKQTNKPFWLVWLCILVPNQIGFFLKYS